MAAESELRILAQLHVPQLPQTSRPHGLPQRVIYSSIAYGQLKALSSPGPEGKGIAKNCLVKRTDIYNENVTPVRRVILLKG